ncbi:putative Ig domain-containing protein [Thioalkalivibrio sulfidiphilus]|uniref:putative Ig domain-containing protein n=1 Tax=Thioalkalivibrio sulfidiphilus TaxID=1033854 RepID=UPI0003A155EA|nr:putative Ig domain-containing protein [Thioalkalivibrio sulfidiphilus]
MKSISLIKRIQYAALLVPFLILLISSVDAKAANYPLEIIQPQPNLNTLNRFYKAYPGLEYNVRMAVTGGNYPYRFELITAPQGMTINNRGVIRWENPSTSGTPYAVTAQVTDVDGSIQTVSWSITVTTNGFLFVDAVNGRSREQGGTGTIDNPWKTMRDVYGGDDYNSKWANFNPGAFVYWREGKYHLDAYLEDCHVDNCRVPWSGRKPLVWLAYPGEKPEINFNMNGRSGHISFYDNVRNLYLDGFDFNLNSNNRGQGINISNNGNVTVRNSTFRGLTNCTHPGTNPSQLFLTGGSGQYTSIQDNYAYESCGYWLLGYVSPKTLVENNTILSDIPLPIGPKHGIQNWTIRGNRIDGQTTRGAIWIQDFSTSGDIEINFNLIQMRNPDGVAIKLLSSDPSGPINVYRNTFIGHVTVDNLTSTKGPFRFNNNVIINNSSNPDKISRTRTVVESRLIVSDNLTGSSQQNIVDNDGNLTATYSQYIGSHGHQIGSTIAPPKQLRLTQ